MLLHTHLNTDNDPDSLSNAIADWCTASMSTGFRRSEWAQSTGTNGPRGYQQAPDGSPLAITYNDIACYGQNREQMNPDVTKQTSLPQENGVTWRFQKNQDNGQTIFFARNDDQPHKCLVCAFDNIKRRAHRLELPKTSPLAVYKITKGKHAGKWAYITDKRVEQALQSAAKAVYKITKREDLQRWSSHSLRVGTCVALHEGGMQPHAIKFRLRWRSDSYKDYLRHTVTISNQQVQAQNNTA